MPAWALGCPNVLSHGEEVRRTEVVVRWCEACSLRESATRNRNYATWLSDMGADSPRYPPDIPENTLDLSGGIDSPVIRIEEEDAADPELQWLTETQDRHLALLKVRARRVRLHVSPTD